MTLPIRVRERPSELTSLCDTRGSCEESNLSNVHHFSGGGLSALAVMKLFLATRKTMARLTKAFSVLLIAVLTLSCVHTTASGAAETGNDGNKLLRNCATTVAIWNIGNSPHPPLTATQAIEAGMCVGYMKGIVDLHVIYRQMKLAKYPLFCLPDGIQPGQWVRIVTKYLQEHPEKLHQRDSLLVVQALMSAFPCKMTQNGEAN